MFHKIIQEVKWHVFIVFMLCDLKL